MPNETLKNHTVKNLLKNRFFKSEIIFTLAS